VVVVIIGILVAIAIPLYLGYKHGAEDKATESDIRNAVPLVEQAFTDVTPNAYPADDTAFQNLAGLHTSSGTTLTYSLNAAGTSYCIQGKQGDTGNTFGVSNQGGSVTKGTCAAGVFTAAP